MIEPTNVGCNRSLCVPKEAKVVHNVKANTRRAVGLGNS